MRQLLILFAFLGYQSFGQCIDPVITDFECTPPSQTLPSTVVSIANSFSGGINTSPNIGQYTDNGTDAFDGLVIDYGTTIDLSTNSVLRFKLYSPTSIQVLAKLEGGTGDVEIWSGFSQVNTWEEFVYDFSAAIGNGNTRLVLFFNAAVTNGTPADLYYFDDLKWDTPNILNIDDISINETKLIALFPNPVDDQINVTSSVDRIKKISVVDLSGKQILQNKVDNLGFYSMDVSLLQSGLYFLEVEFMNVLEVEKIKIVKK
ncbi:T9SS type A sorting domain-containing protein [Aquimarina sp. 2201CG5-10]|uniref:T9SS type A sorting domain-containing protein n=1 Tax=Aquimarina callyspongiae TaxID=3098150 RepID=UPI002AB56A3A|nr:T9SS type A sorting domain-containing protein [Aquimarina sp. 2201CG5-10]MDY8134353.1 T9SS type A sorting domain-containing protein [Aquimarina sp. 2201CG5-10]